MLARAVQPASLRFEHGEHGKLALAPSGRVATDCAIADSAFGARNGTFDLRARGDYRPEADDAPAPPRVSLARSPRCTRWAWIARG